MHETVSTNGTLDIKPRCDSLRRNELSSCSAILPILLSNHDETCDRSEFDALDLLDENLPCTLHSSIIQTSLLEIDIQESLYYFQLIFLHDF